MERTIEFSDVVGIRFKCGACGAVGLFTRDQIVRLLKKSNLMDSLRCPKCKVLPAAELNPAQLEWVSNASVLLDAVHNLAATQSGVKPIIKLSLAVRSRA